MGVYPVDDCAETFWPLMRQAVYEVVLINGPAAPMPKPVGGEDRAQVRGGIGREVGLGIMPRSCVGGPICVYKHN